jgi:hypothetical protein
MVQDEAFMRAASRVRVTDSLPESPIVASRRRFLRALTLSSTAMVISPSLAAASRDGTAAEAHRDAGPQGAHHAGDDEPVIRTFARPYLELVRLLREATEVEHALMVQYLYGAFSLKPIYADVAGTGAPGATDLIGVAVQEMQHLALVNRLLVELGAAPNLVRQDFPYEPDIYPFAFRLEPLGPVSLAKYVYAEAPAAIFAAAPGSADYRLAAKVMRLIGPSARPNHIGSLYDAILARLAEWASGGGTAGIDVTRWSERLEQVKSEGENEHFRFFRSVLEGEHPGFGGRSHVWDLPPAHPDYPAYCVPTDPSAFIAHENGVMNPTLAGLGWLGNLHYWAVLVLLDAHFRHGDERYLQLAREQMLGPVWSLARYLPTIGGGMPFDHLNVGYSPALDARHTCGFVEELLGEADAVAKALAAKLPADYPMGGSIDAAREVRTLAETSAAGHAHAPL